jgi:hypothetical protein
MTVFVERPFLKIDEIKVELQYLQMKRRKNLLLFLFLQTDHSNIELRCRSTMCFCLIFCFYKWPMITAVSSSEKETESNTFFCKLIIQRFRYNARQRCAFDGFFFYKWPMIVTASKCCCKGRYQII